MTNIKNMINLKPAIEAGYTGRGVEVGIVDTGESVGSISFPELYGRKEHGYNENYKNKLQKLYGVYAGRKRLKTEAVKTLKLLWTMRPL